MMYTSVEDQSGEIRILLVVTELEKALLNYTTLTLEEIENLCKRLENFEGRPWDAGVLPRNVMEIY